jgi:hypothetical protein
MKTIRILAYCVTFGVTIGVVVLLSSIVSHTKAAGNEVSVLNVSIREWDVPTKGSNPHDPAVGPDGALWFTEQYMNKLGRLDPVTGTMREYPLKTNKSGPHGLVADKEGNIWYTGNYAGLIGKLNPRTGEITEYKMPDVKASDPHTPVFDQQGILWFTVQGGNFVGRLDPHTGKIDLKLVPTKDALPYGMGVNSKGTPFFCEFGTNKMAKIGYRSGRQGVLHGFRGRAPGKTGPSNGRSKDVGFPRRADVESLWNGDHRWRNGLVQRGRRRAEYRDSLRSQNGGVCQGEDSVRRRRGAQYGCDRRWARIHRVQRRQ